MWNKTLISPFRLEVYKCFTDSLLYKLGQGVSKTKDDIELGEVGLSVLELD